MGTYDLLFYIATGASVYVSFATIGIIMCMRRAGRLENQSQNKHDSIEQSEQYTITKQDVLCGSKPEDERSPLVKHNHSYNGDL